MLFDVLALLLDPGGNLKKREDKGYLVVTDRGLIFGTARHSILIELARFEIKVPTTVKNKFLMAELSIKTILRGRTTPSC